MKNAKTLLDSAQEAAQVAETWADLSNVLFAPDTGLVARAFPTRKERAAFLQTDEYRAIRQLIEEARQRTGLFAGATPSTAQKGHVECAFATGWYVLSRRDSSQ